MFIPVVMAGGSGSRLWPLSRSMFPKQFLPLFDKDNQNKNDKKTMLQATIERMHGLDTSSPIIISNEEHRFIVAEQLRKISIKADIILEPVGRNTAPAIALAAFQALKMDPDAILLVLAADHVILDTPAFQQSIRHALSYAQNDYLVTFGIVASAPETGYGYIQRGEMILDFEQQQNGFKVERFTEKPCLEEAQKYIKSGDYYWNSGCFMFKANVYLEELNQFRPDIFNACKQSMAEIKNDLDFIRIKEDSFIQCPDESVDYAVMEETQKAIVVPMDAGWSDVGSWSALWDVSDKDENGNVFEGDVIFKEANNCLIYAPNKLVAAVGLDNIVVVETKDAVLVADKSKVQEVKKVVEHLKADQRSEYKEHRESYHFWGISDAIDAGTRYKTNRITVKPGQKSIKQCHYHRAEHWIVVSGTAKVVKGDDIIILTENQSIYIPVGVPHCMENPGKIDLEVIEVQSGSYLESDDVKRFEDNSSSPKYHLFDNNKVK